MIGGVTREGRKTIDHSDYAYAMEETPDSFKVHVSRFPSSPLLTIVPLGWSIKPQHEIMSDT